MDMGHAEVAVAAVAPVAGRAAAANSDDEGVHNWRSASLAEKDAAVDCKDVAHVA
jgi:hypothetical protein